MPESNPNPRPASPPRKKFWRALVTGLLTVGGMAATNYLQLKPELAAAVPVILGPLGGWLRDKFPDSANAIPF